MVKPIDIAEAAHEICLSEFIPKGVHKPHEVIEHLPVLSFIADKINEAGLENVTGKQVADIILQDWYREFVWKGHPHPDDIIAQLRGDKGEDK